MIDAVGPIQIRARGAATAAVGEARVLLTNVAWPLYQAIAGRAGIGPSLVSRTSTESWS